MFLTPLLPYPSFRQSVACYSKTTLVAMLASLDKRCHTFCTRDIDLSWEQRDLLRFWKGHKQAFIRFGLMCVEEAKQRGGLYSQDAVSWLRHHKEGKQWQKPLWSGWERLHSDHRGILLQLGEVDRICDRMHKYRDKIDGLSDTCSPYLWLNINGFGELARGDVAYTRIVSQFLDDTGVPPLTDDECPNHYMQFNWSEKPDGEQRTWPPENGTWFATRVSESRGGLRF